MDEQLKFLLDNEEFIAKLLSKEEPEDVQKLFSDNGVEITLDEIKAIGKELEKVDAESGEIFEHGLEDVAGGVSFTDYIDGTLSEIKRKLITQTRRRLIKFSKQW